METTNRPRFEDCTLRATHLLSKQNRLNRAISIRKLRYDKRIIFDTVQNYVKISGLPLDVVNHDLLSDGCVLIRNGIYIILYEESSFGNWQRFNWTLAHEVGHIYMEHRHHGPCEEVEAHFFASQLFMPEYTLRRTVNERGALDAKDISTIFWVSEQAARKRIVTLKKYRSKEWLPEDRVIYSGLHDRIEFYFYCKDRGLDFHREMADKDLRRAEEAREAFEYRNFM